MLWVLQKTKVALGNMLVFEYNSIKGEWPPILWEAIWGYATDDLKDGYKVVGAPLYKNIVHQPYLANLLVFIPLVERLIGLPDTVIPVILESATREDLGLTANQNVLVLGYRIRIPASPQY